MITRTTGWLNANRYRRYPFREDVDLRAISGDLYNLELPNDVLLDFQLTVYAPRLPYGAPYEPPYRLQTFHLVSAAEVLLTFGTGTIPLFTISIPVSAAFPYRVTGSFTGHLGDGGVLGVAGEYTVIFGPGCTTLFAAAEAGHTGVFNFTTSYPDLEPALVVHVPQHEVERLRCTGRGSGNSGLYGIITVSPGFNCDVAVSPDSIRWTVGAGRGLGKPCETIEDVTTCGKTLLRINGANGSDDGNIPLAAGRGVEIVPEADDHRIIVRASPKALEMKECG